MRIFASKGEKACGQGKNEEIGGEDITARTLKSWEKLNKEETMAQEMRPCPHA